MGSEMCIRDSSYITHLIEKRSSGFKDLFDLTKKTDIKLGGKKSIEALAKSGGFDSISPSRSIAIEALEDVCVKDKKHNLLRRISFLLSSKNLILMISIKIQVIYLQN